MKIGNSESKFVYLVHLNMTNLIVAAHPAIEFHKEKADAKRIGWIDSARGICIFLVVVGHVIGGIKGAKLADDASALGADIITSIRFTWPRFLFCPA